MVPVADQADMDILDTEGLNVLIQTYRQYSLYRLMVPVADQADMDSLSAVGHYLVVVANVTGRHARS